MDYQTTAKPKAMAGAVPVFCAHDAIVDVVKLIPNPKNPNKHPDDQVALLARVIQAAGWRQPITVSTRSGFIVKGHGRLLAAQAAGLEAVPVDYQDYATEAEEYADLVADNRLAELSEIDSRLLADVFKDIDPTAIPVELTGYNEKDFTDILEVFAHVEEGDVQAAAGGEDYEYDRDDIDGEAGEDFKSVGETHLAHKCPRCGFEFD